MRGLRHHLVSHVSYFVAQVVDMLRSKLNSVVGWGLCVRNHMTFGSCWMVAVLQIGTGPMETTKIVQSIRRCVIYSTVNDSADATKNNVHMDGIETHEHQLGRL